MTNMKMSPYGRHLLVQREGLRLKAYRDSVGVWTIGVGHTSMAGPPRVVPGMTITMAQADQILQTDLPKYEASINAALKRDIPQNQFDALVSICYNVGPRFAKSSTVIRLNVGNVKGAAQGILAWNKPSVIIGRRHTEYVQFITPYTDAQRNWVNK